jgi:hypothetical protein
MKTRRSWRNQNKLFKDLFKPAEAKPPAPVDAVERLQIILADPFLNKRVRADYQRQLDAELLRRKVAKILEKDNA